MMLLTAGAFAQGTVTFANSSATAITNISLVPAARPAVGTILVGLFGSTTLGLGIKNCRVKRNGKRKEEQGGEN